MALQSHRVSLGYKASPGKPNSQGYLPEHRMMKNQMTSSCEIIIFWYLLWLQEFYWNELYATGTILFGHFPISWMQYQIFVPQSF